MYQIQTDESCVADVIDGRIFLHFGGVEPSSYLSRPKQTFFLGGGELPREIWYFAAEIELYTKQQHFAAPAPAAF